MPIKRTTQQSEITNAINAYMETTRWRLIRRMMVIGEKVLTEVRNNGSYLNQTGNLRSSTGYIVVEEGNPITVSAFQTIMNGQQGSQEGRNYAMSLAGNYPTGITLIVVAGMQYAAYVAAKGKDVLDSGELLAKKLVPQMLQELGLSKR